jgi:hypothetical protein
LHRIINVESGVLKLIISLYLLETQNNELPLMNPVEATYVAWLANWKVSGCCALVARENETSPEI